MPPRSPGLLLLLLAGCAYKVHIASEPPGASVTLPNKEVVTAPTTVRLRHYLGKPQLCTATLPGYRDLSVDLRTDGVHWQRFLLDPLLRPSTLTGAPRDEITLHFVRRHGRSGTWSVEDAE